jgi:hypothetical protein
LVAYCSKSFQVIRRAPQRKLDLGLTKIQNSTVKSRESHFKIGLALGLGLVHIDGCLGAAVAVVR